MTFAFAVGILGMVNRWSIFLGLPPRDSMIFFSFSLSPEIHRYDASIEYDVFSVVIY